MTRSQFNASSNTQQGSTQRALTISDREDFGNFCQSLIENKVRFSLGGFQTVFLSEAALENLPEQPRVFLSRLERSHLIKCTAPTQERKRHIPTQREVDEILKGFAEKRRHRARH